MLNLSDQCNIVINKWLSVKPEFLGHPILSGNKYRKLKYNLEAARSQNFTQVLTFGGAYSNHISAVAAAGQAYGFSTIGVIRGEELVAKNVLNPTLRFAKSCGMHFKFVARADYRVKTSAAFRKKLEAEFGDFYMVPEGGTNLLAVKGCEEILSPDDAGFDYICCPVGTGGTIAGVINSSLAHQKILGFPALKGRFLQEEITKFARKTNWELVHDYHFGGYAKINPDLISFINRFKSDHKIPLDPIYTGKMLYGICDMMEKGHFPENSKILAIHTGGLQGIEGMNLQLKQKQLPLIG